MFMSREIDIKRCQNYTKTYMYEILYKIQQIRNQSENYYIPEENEDEQKEMMRMSRKRG